MIKAGLTGSIAVGKTFVCDVLRELGCHIIDADVISRDVVGPETDGLKQIVREFGPLVLKEDGELDRGKLGEIVFADPAKRQLLNSIVHPLVIEEQNRLIRALEEEYPDGIVVVDAALMIESGGYKRFDKLIVVFCDPELQLRRLMERNGLSEAEARQRIDSQMPHEEKKRFATHLIDTSGGFEEPRRQTEKIFRELSTKE
ncbi:MAG TPA: dephospho-CoA kinase [Pyrinomonadaceae bacterium]|nr:dephospho-CoA kinase [Pyrinomonadaceae bacterium]